METGSGDKLDSSRTCGYGYVFNPTISNMKSSAAQSGPAHFKIEYVIFGDAKKTNQVTSISSSETITQFSMFPNLAREEL